MSRERLILFVKEGCPYCKAAMDYLDSKNMGYERREVRTNPEYMKELQKISGQTKTPTLLIDGDVLADFDVEQLDPFLTKHRSA